MGNLYILLAVQILMFYTFCQNYHSDRSVPHACRGKMLIKSFDFSLVAFIIGDNGMGTHLMDLLINRHKVITRIHYSILKRE